MAGSFEAVFERIPKPDKVLAVSVYSVVDGRWPAAPQKILSLASNTETNHDSHFKMLLASAKDQLSHDSKGD